MKKRQVKNLFKKYVNDECTPREIELLNSYLESFQDKSLLLKDLNYDDDIKNEIWQKISLNSVDTKIDSIKKNTYSFNKYLKYAAILIVTIGVSFYVLKNYSSIQEPTLVITDQSIILRTSDNKKVVINPDTEQSLYKNGAIVGKQNGSTISYLSNKEVNELVYNEIEIPNGKTFKLVLSDGTLVHLNAGTTMKYPVNFIYGKHREIYLKGEAYFEVAKDSKHPFVVNTDEMGVKVLGTHFSVNSYENTKTYAVLAEGSVVAYSQYSKEDISQSKTLRPGQKASLNKENIQINNVDVNDYLNWRDGRLIFNNDTFVDIVKKIERKYNVTIKNEYLKLNNIRFKGNFKGETIIDLLDTFKESAGFNYQIIDNEIIINKP